MEAQPPIDEDDPQLDDLDLRQRITLIELVDRVLNKGVVVSGDITLAVADVDLVYVGLRVLIASVATLEEGHRQGR
jgi:gas vesicle structural protein